MTDEEERLLYEDYTEICKKINIKENFNERLGDLVAILLRRIQRLENRIKKLEEVSK